jgi:hypothetical protein
MNEGTWVKYPPPVELLQFIERSMQSDFQTPEAWKALLGGAGLEVSTFDREATRAIEKPCN